MKALRAGQPVAEVYTFVAPYLTSPHLPFSFFFSFLKGSAELSIASSLRILNIRDCICSWSWPGWTRNPLNSGGTTGVDQGFRWLLEAGTWVDFSG